mgnify:CR=1 FL=1
MNFQIGCAVWAYKEWVGNLFPTGSRTADFLRLYSRRFTTVEGNTTFYSVPDAATTSRWADETPSGFKFCLKLPRDVTHQGLLMPQIEAAIAFINQMQGLGDRLGPLIIQLPPSYSPSQMADLTSFLEALQPTQAALALEVRHLAWFRADIAPKLTALLQQRGVGRVMLDTRPIYDCPDDPQIYSERRKPRVPLTTIPTADFTLVRYISHPTLELNDSFMHEWVAQLDLWLRAGQQIYFFVHCPTEAKSPVNARYMQHLLEQLGVPVPELPWNAIAAESPPNQLSLF